MTKPTFRPMGSDKSDKSTSSSHNKNPKTYQTTNAQRGRLRDNNFQGFNSNSKITSFFQRKIPQQIPNV